jgi:hypothetical protein
MTEGFASIVTELERQKAVIDRALAALREIGGIGAPDAAVSTLASIPEASARKGQKRSAAVRERMKEAQQLRWAKKRGESEPPAAVTPEHAKPKRQISEEGMKRIIAATKKRWALKRAEAALKNAKPNQTVRKKAAVPALPAKAAKKSVPVKKTVVKKSAKAPARAVTTAADE